MQEIFSQNNIMFYNECAVEQDYCHNKTLREALADENGDILDDAGNVICNINNVPEDQTSKEDGSTIILANVKGLAAGKILTQLDDQSLNKLLNSPTAPIEGENNLDTLINKLEKAGELRKNIIITLRNDGTPVELLSEKLLSIANTYPQNEFIYIVSEDNNENTLHRGVDLASRNQNNITLLDWQSLREEENIGQNARLAQLIYDAIPGGLDHFYDRTNESFARNALIDQEIDNLSNDVTNLSLTLATAKEATNIDPFYYNPVNRTAGMFAYRDDELVDKMKEIFGENVFTTKHSSTETEKAIDLQIAHYYGREAGINAYKSKNLAYIESSKAIATEDREERFILADRYKIWCGYFSESCNKDTSYGNRIANLSYSYYQSYQNQSNFVTEREDYYYLTDGRGIAKDKNELYVIDGWIAGGANNVVRVAASEIAPRNAESYFNAEYETSNTYTNTIANKITIFLDEEEKSNKIPHFAVDGKTGTIYQYRDLRYTGGAIDGLDSYAGVEIALINTSEDELLTNKVATTALSSLTDETAAKISLEYDTPSYFEPQTQIAKANFKSYSGIIVSGQTTAFSKPSLVRYGSYLKNFMLR